MRAHTAAKVLDPTTRSAYSREPRHVVQKAEAGLRNSGIADTSILFMEPPVRLGSAERVGGSRE